MKLGKRRGDIVAAPVIGGVVAVMAFFILYSMAGFQNMGGDIAGIGFGLFLSLVMAVIAGAVVFGELMARALES